MVLSFNEKIVKGDMTEKTVIERKNLGLNRKFSRM